MIDQVVSAFGGLNVLYNNAGIIFPGPVEEFDVEGWDRQFAVNVRGPFLCTKHAMRT